MISFSSITSILQSIGNFIVDNGMKLLASGSSNSLVAKLFITMILLGLMFLSLGIAKTLGTIIKTTIILIFSIMIISIIITLV